MAALEARSLLTCETIHSTRSTWVGGILRMVGGLRSEPWAPSNQNAGRHQIGIGGRLALEFARNALDRGRGVTRVQSWAGELPSIDRDLCLLDGLIHTNCRASVEMGGPGHRGRARVIEVSRRSVQNRTVTGFQAQPWSSRACNPVGFIAPPMQLLHRRLRGASLENDDGRRPRAYRSAPLFARRGRAGPSPCSSVSLRNISFETFRRG
jgi:hypothetical protein